MTWGIPIPGTLAATYLAHRGILDPADLRPLRFHAGCYHRTGGTTRALPALLAACRDEAGRMTGILRTWLADDGFGKAAVRDPRKALGLIHGSPVELGDAEGVMAAGEGLETMLTLRLVAPGLPCRATLAAAHLPAIPLPANLTRLYIAPDNDHAGRHAANLLSARACTAGLDVHLLVPPAKDWNDALRAFGFVCVRDSLCRQLAPEDRSLLAVPPGRWKPR